MGERAECVMLNKGTHVTSAVRTLDDILTRMQHHQEKKSSQLPPAECRGSISAPALAGARGREALTSSTDRHRPPVEQQHFEHDDAEEEHELPSIAATPR